MPTFSIQHGPTPLCSFDLDTGSTKLHPGRQTKGDILVLEESEKVNFVLAPQPEGYRHRIFVGDVPLSDIVASADDAFGSDMGSQLIWRGLPYFESARGFTKLLLESQPESASDDRWHPVVSLDLYVLPSKLGEARYDRMASELQDVSRSLLVDLYGKSRQTHDIRYAKEGRVHSSREQELASIVEVLGHLSELLAAVARNPASRLATEPCMTQFWGCERLQPSAITAMCRTGISPRQGARPVLIRGLRRLESFDTPEHRVIRAFLDIIERRASCCAQIAQAHIRAILSERHLRHIRRAPQPTLYETVDMPKVKRLHLAAATAFGAASRATALANLPFLRDVRPELVSVRGGAFQRGQHYRALLSLIRRFLLANAVWYEGGDMSEITKLTSRLYEQWCYLKVVEAFRQCGLVLREWTDALRANLRSRFILDFDRGLAFEGILSTGLRIRFRYEPWILGTESAAKAGETLCRGSATDVAWSPDIVIECLTRDGDGWSPVYAIVLDSKYKTRHQQFDGIMKYSEIRCTKTRRQLVKQLWIISPPLSGASPAISSEDPAVHFTSAGLSSAPGDTLRFRLAAAPDSDPQADSDSPAASGVFRQFAQGTINFLLREFS